MTAPHRQGAGALPVGALDALPPLPALAVRALRRWCDGGEAALGADLGASLGRDAPAGAEAFGAFARLALAAARRPLLRHAAGCAGLGADEAIVAEILRAATEGEREEALMLACALIRPDLAPALVGHAQAAGLHLARALVRRPAVRASGTRLH